MSGYVVPVVKPAPTVVPPVTNTAAASVAVAAAAVATSDATALFADVAANASAIEAESASRTTALPAGTGLLGQGTESGQASPVSVGGGLGLSAGVLALRPPSTSVLGGVLAAAAGTSYWVRGIATDGTLLTAQPATTDLSDWATASSAISAGMLPVGGGAMTPGAAITGLGSVTINQGSAALTVGGAATLGSVVTPSMYLGRGFTFNYAGSQSSNNQYGLLFSGNPAGYTTAGYGVNLNSIVVNQDSVILGSPAPTGTTWLNVGGNVGRLSWAVGGYGANSTVNNLGHVYTTAAGGTSAAPGPTHTTGTAADGGGVSWTYAGEDWAGCRTGLAISLGFRGQAGSANVNDNWSQHNGVLTTVTVTAPQGGTAPTSGSSRGFFYATSDELWATNNATNLSGLTGREIDVGIWSPASAAQRTGLQVVSYGNVAGHDVDVAYRAGITQAGGSNVAWGTAYSVDPGGVNSATGTVLGLFKQYPGSYGAGGTQIPLAAAGLGIDLPLSFATAAIRLPGGFVVDPAGALNIGGLKVSPSSAGATIDVVGKVVTAIAINAPGVNYCVGDIINDVYGDIVQVTAVTGGTFGPISAISVLHYGGSTGGSYPTTGITASLGSGAGATFNLTWSTTTSLSISPTGGAVSVNGVTVGGGSGVTLGSINGGNGVGSTSSGFQIVGGGGNPVVVYGYGGNTILGALYPNGVSSSGNYLQLQPAASGSAPVLTVGAVSDTNVGLTLTPKGTGIITMGGGVSHGSAVASSITDLSKHIALYGTSYGLNMTSASLNIIASGQVQVALGSGTVVLTVQSAGTISSGGFGFWGVTPPSSKPAAPTTLANVISLLQSYGLSS